jgi:hypothetical protein
MPSGLNSPNEVYFFTKNPQDYKLPSGYFDYEITRADERTLESAKSETRKRGRLEIVQFSEPKVDVQGKTYTYVVRSTARRDNFKQVMSPEPAYQGKRPGIPGLHYAASDTFGDAIGLTIESETPEAAKEQFQTWYAKIKEMLKVLEERFAILNKELDQKIEESAAQRLDELNRAQKAL